MQTRFHVTHNSQQRKCTGMTVTRSTTNTCPPSCPVHPDSGGGCYDALGNGRFHRAKHDKGLYKSTDLPTFTKRIESDPNWSSIWRYAEGGDLPGEGDRISLPDTMAIVEACNASRRRPIIYTHKPIEGIHQRGTRADRVHNRKALRALLAAADGFTVNISCETREQVQAAHALGLDAVLIVPTDAPRTDKTRAVPLVGCPNAFDARFQCGPTWGNGRKACGSGEPLCIRKGRGFAVTFPAHGSKRVALSAMLISKGNA